MPLVWPLHHKPVGSISVQHVIGYRKRETPQGGQAKGSELARAYRYFAEELGVSVGAGRRRRPGLRPPRVEYLGTPGGKIL